MELKAFYGDTITRRDGWAANDYGSARSQWRRFTTAAASLGIRQGDRVNDVGCGTGEFSAWLHNHGLDVDWRGFDVLPEMALEVQRRHDRTVTVLNAFERPLPLAEFSVAIGLLGVLEGAHDERMLNAARLMKNLDEASSLAWAVSTQTSRNGKSDPDPRRWFPSPRDLQEMAFTMFPDRPIAVRADYHPFDMMIVVNKSGF